MMYDKRSIMTRAWQIFRKAAGTLPFAEALHRAWQVAKAKPVNAARILAAKLTAGITEEVNTWKAWRDRGFEVIHGSRCLFQVELIQASRGDGAPPYRASFFSASQVVPFSAVA